MMTQVLFIELEQENKTILNMLDYHLRFYFPEILNVVLSNSVLKIEYVKEMDENRVNSFVNDFIERHRLLMNKEMINIFYESGKSNKWYTTQNGRQNLHFNHFLNLTKEFLESIRQLPKSDMSFEHYIVQRSQVGINLYNKSISKFIKYLDTYLCGLFEKMYDSEEVYPPSLVTLEVAAKCGYFENGCNHISFVAPLTNNIDKYRGYEKSIKERGLETTQSKTFYESYCRKTNSILNPALCIHCYPVFENKNYENNQFSCMTLYGSSFRDESGNLNNYERLKEFHMREAVFLGDKAKIDEIHKELIQLLIWIGELFQFNFSIEASNDIFFNDNADKLLFSQRLTVDKLEMLVYSNLRKKRISIASINKHHIHFSKPYNIRVGDEYAETMCIGFGFDRIILPFLEKLSHEEDYTSNVIEAIRTLAKGSDQYKV